MAKHARGALAEARVNASELSRRYGGAVSYWTRRLNGELVMNIADVERIAQAARVHPAVLVGGQAPDGWLPRRDSNLEPSDYRTLFGRRMAAWGVAA